MIKVLAVLDALVAIILLLEVLSVHMYWRIALAAMVYLGIKAWLFWPDFLSLIDGAIGLMILIGVVYINIFAGIAGLLWLGWKSAASFF